MLEQIAIKNFQAHRELILPIEPTLTIIRGPSDAGKSSVIRGFRWLMFNRAGKKFITYGEKRCSVAAWIDGVKLERKKEPGLNAYILDGEPFKAIGVKVPERIQKFLNVSEINFQFQRDQPLWIALTPAQASKELNRIINLEMIDSSLGYIGKETHKRSVLVDGTKSRLAEAKGERKDLAWVLEADRDLQGIERLETHINVKREGLAAAERLIAELDSLQSELARSSRRRVEAAAILSDMVKLRERQKERDRLHTLLKEIERLESTLEDEECQLSKLETLLAKVKVCPTCKQPVLYTSH